MCVAALSASVGCVTASPSRVVRVRAANDFDCSKDEISIKNIGGTSFRAEGCGQSVVYDCAGSTVVVTGKYGGGTSDYVCIPETPVRPPTAAAPPPAQHVEQPSQPDESSASTAGGEGDGEDCRQAFKHIDDLTSAWRRAVLRAAGEQLDVTRP